MRDRFIPTNNDLSYYPLLFMALEATKGDVIELGTGYGSTQLLHDYCKKRNLWSYEEKREWFDKFIEFTSAKHKLNFVSDWDVVDRNHLKCSVLFVDHAPGERRKVDILNFQNKAEIIVCHDTEPAADYGYQMRQYFDLFKYVVEVKTDGAWASAMSNTIDLTQWVGKEFGNYKISNYDNTGAI